MADIHISKNIQCILDMLENAGFEAWIVGGYVRDAILQKESLDCDIATNASWQEVEQAASSFQTIRTGIKHGTITVIIDDEPFEVTTYRSDGAYSDSRHPNEVTFVNSIEEDLARRDFTINAIAYHPKRGLFDPFGGLDDIKTQTIRTVGDPDKRFSEDALRILRGCRFASQLGFRVDLYVLKAMIQHKYLLRKISIERITHELDFFVMGSYVHDALMETVDVISFVVPELVAMIGFEQKTKYHKYDVLEHTAWVMQNCPQNRILRWAALCHDMGKPAAAFFDDDGVEHFYGHASISVKIAEGLLKRLLMSNKMIAQTLTLVKIHDDVISPTEKSVRKTLKKLNGDVELFQLLCDLKKADALSQADMCISRVDDINSVLDCLNKILEENKAFSIKDLAIDGDDLIKAGFVEGPIIKEMLNAALDAVIEETIPNDNDALIGFILENFEITNDESVRS